MRRGLDDYFYGESGLESEVLAAASSANVTGAIITGAVIGAAGNYMSAKQSNKPKKGYTDQTTTQTPYKDDLYGPDIEAVLGYARGLVQQGTPQLDKHGNITYTQLPTGSRPATTTGTPTTTPGPGGGGKLTSINSPSSGSSGSSRKPSTWVNARGETMTVGAGGKAVKAGAGANNPAAGNPGSGVTAGPNLSTPQGIFTEVAKRGLDAGNTETQTGARNLMSNIWGAAGTPGGSTQAGAGAEVTGFEGYNPILDRQAQRLESGADNRVGRNLLLNFLGENKRSGEATRTDSRAALNFGANPGSGGSVSYQPQSQQAAEPGVSPSKARRGMLNQEWAAKNMPAPEPEAGDGDPSAQSSASMQQFQQQQSGPVYGRPAGPNDVPDTMAVQSFFGDETRKIMDEQANESELQALIDAMAEDVQRGTFRERAALDAAAAGSGRFGGSTWAAQNRDLSEEAAQELLKSSSAIRVGDRDARRNARLAALAGVGQRDLGLLGANVQREGIAANERSAANAAAAAGAGQEAQMQLAMRGQDLAAISDLLGYEQFEMGQLGNIGGQLSGDRLSSLGMVPGLEGIGLAGLNATLGAGGGMVDMRGQDVQSKIASQQAGIARQGLNQQLGMFNAGQGQGLVNNYLGTLMNIGQMGGTSRTQGTNVVPGLGVSPTGAALTGAAGGAATGAGLYNMYRGY